MKGLESAIYANTAHTMPAATLSLDTQPCESAHPPFRGSVRSPMQLEFKPSRGPGLMAAEREARRSGPHAHESTGNMCGGGGGVSVPSASHQGVGAEQGETCATSAGATRGAPEQGEESKSQSACGPGKSRKRERKDTGEVRASGAEPLGDSAGRKRRAVATASAVESKSADKVGTSTRGAGKRPRESVLAGADLGENGHKRWRH